MSFSAQGKSQKNKKKQNKENLNKMQSKRTAAACHGMKNVLITIQKNKIRTKSGDANATQNSKQCEGRRKWPSEQENRHNIWRPSRRSI